MFRSQRDVRSAVAVSLVDWETLLVLYAHSPAEDKVMLSRAECWLLELCLLASSNPRTLRLVSNQCTAHQQNSIV